jgi:hypothetical protein
MWEISSLPRVRVTVAVTRTAVFIPQVGRSSHCAHTSQPLCMYDAKSKVKAILVNLRNYVGSSEKR